MFCLTLLWEQKFEAVIQIRSHINHQVLMACFFIIKFAEHKFCSQLSEVGNTDFFFHKTLLIQRNYAQLVILKLILWKKSCVHKVLKI